MNEEQMELFRTVCFLAMMQHGKGLSMKHPKYIREKMKVCEDPVAAWNSLDVYGQDVVTCWAHKWHFPIVECLEEILKEVTTQ